MKKLLFPSLLIVNLIFLSFSLIGQSLSPLDIAFQTLRQNYTSYNLSDKDINDIVVSDNVYTTSNGMSNIYLTQRYEGIEIHNAILNFTISKEGNIVYTGNRFINRINSRINTIKAKLKPEDALKRVVSILGSSEEIRPSVKTIKSDKSFVFDKGTISRRDIPVKLKYQLLDDGSLRLVWDVAIDYINGNDYWSIRVDALTGEMIDKKSFTVHCKLSSELYKSHDDCDVNPIDFYPSMINIKEDDQRNNLLMANQYNVFPFPLESPRQGNRVLITNPSNPVASPFGWHDTNGVSGNEYTITRGNNVHAFEDRDADFSSKGNEPNGGNNLVFDFPLNLTKEPDQNINPATVQLFYAVNFMHDFSFGFGFDEYANFQEHNYTATGQADDQINALCQFDGNTLINVNNAEFTTPEDGGNGTMKMFLWDKSLSAGKNMLVNAPFNVAGAYSTSAADFGPQLTFENPITGFAEIANDGSVDNPTFACEPLSNGNGADLKGKIAIIDRGGCDFDAKVLNAQNNGAIAVIVCNFNENSIPMGTNLVGDQVTIPSVMIKKSDCDKIRVTAGAGGLNITLQGQPTVSAGPLLTDGSLDNGIIAHEFTHGISTRLTGGPGNSGCLDTGEQMGEGWSDFIAMAATVKSYDTKNKIRGFGNYVTNEDTLGKGLRQYPFSPNMNINPHTYADIINNNEIHYVGEVWATMLWDLYWAMVDKYGLDTTYKNVNSGSYKAVKLVIDAMKIQPCHPGFVDGRDAILAADQLNYSGENECLIWDVFARRGLGQLADQNDPDKTEDAVQNFDTKNICLNRLVVKKESTPLIQAGEEIIYTITVSNYKNTVTNNVVVNDIIPAGTNYVNGSASMTPIINGDVISFNLGNMNVSQVSIITYKVKSSTSIYSISQLYDNCESLDNWDIESIMGSSGWNPVSNKSHSPTMSFGINDIGDVTRQDLLFTKEYNVQGTRPVLRFYQNYNTEQGSDGGFVELSEDGVNYVNAKNYFIRHGYPSKISYATFVLPNLEAFTGNSNGWVASYIDLKDFAGKKIKKVRIRYGSDDKGSGVSWNIDDLEYMDMKNYNTEVCVTSTNGDMECTKAPEEGTIVESKTTATNDLHAGKLDIYPNPASNYISVALNTQSGGKHNLEIVTLDGKVILVSTLNLKSGNNVESIDVSKIPSGCYIIKIQNDKYYYVNKIVLKN